MVRLLGEPKTGGPGFDLGNDRQITIGDRAPLIRDRVNPPDRVRPL